ncbi:hypothetical protein ScPMuIL_007959 [Solemya velum]
MQGRTAVTWRENNAQNALCDRHFVEGPDVWYRADPNFARNYAAISSNYTVTYDLHRGIIDADSCHTSNRIGLLDGYSPDAYEDPVTRAVCVQWEQSMESCSNHSKLK